MTTVVKSPDDLLRVTDVMEEKGWGRNKTYARMNAMPHLTGPLQVRRADLEEWIASTAAAAKD